MGGRSLGRLGQLLLRASWALAVATLLATVLAGSLAPALYGGSLPHAHLFLGGPPPPGWQRHAHLNPLAVFLGSPAPHPHESDQPAGEPGASADQRHWGRVVSLYPAGVALIMSLLALDLVMPAALSPRGLVPLDRLRSAPIQRPSTIGHAPDPPPPRLHHRSAA